MEDEAERKNMDSCERVVHELGRVQTTKEQHQLVEEVRARYLEMGQILLGRLPHNPTLENGLRHLVASKDDAIRAILFP